MNNVLKILSQVQDTHVICKFMTAKFNKILRLKKRGKMKSKIT